MTTLIDRQQFQQKPLIISYLTTFVFDWLLSVRWHNKITSRQSPPALTPLLKQSTLSLASLVPAHRLMIFFHSQIFTAFAPFYLARIHGLKAFAGFGWLGGSFAQLFYIFIIPIQFAISPGYLALYVIKTLGFVIRCVCGRTY